MDKQRVATELLKLARSLVGSRRVKGLTPAQERVLEMAKEEWLEAKKVAESDEKRWGSPPIADRDLRFALPEAKSSSVNALVKKGLLIVDSSKEHSRSEVVTAPRSFGRRWTTRRNTWTDVRYRAGWL